MGKAGFFFFTGDWLKDTRTASLEVRGAWIDLLCLLFENNGEITCSYTDLAHFWGTLSAKCPSIVHELSRLNLASVQENSGEFPGNIRITSRRMRREFFDKENDRLRKRDKSKKKRFRRISGKFPENFRKISGDFPPVNLNPSLNPSLNLNQRGDKDKDKRPPAAAFELPPFLEKKVWDGFVKMRETEGHPLTEEAAQLICEKLAQFEKAGHNANEILNNSTRNGWRDVYEPRPQIGIQAEGELSERTKRILRRGL